MSDKPIRNKLQEGIIQAKNGMAIDAKSAFMEFEKEHE